MTSSHDIPTIGSLFTGYSGLDMGVAAALGGGGTIWASDIEPGPCAIGAYHAPGTPNLGDVTRVDGTALERPDVICGGSPCFPAGALVLTSHGPTPIERVRVGDLVLTHRGRWRPVSATGSRIADTVTVTGRGALPVECTPSHPFLSALPLPGGRVTDPVWTRADLMAGRLWLLMGHAARLDDTRPAGVPWGVDLMALAGLWLACGVTAPEGMLTLSTPAALADRARVLSARLGLDARERAYGARLHVTIPHAPLAAWLDGLFGPVRRLRSLPAWMLGMDAPLRAAFLDSWLDAKGRRDGTRVTVTTSSRALAVGVAMLAASLGRSAGMRPTSHGLVALDVYERPRTARAGRLGVWMPVRAVGAGRRAVCVWNLSVMDDESYTVDGIAVHNCQSVSIAGLRAGMTEGTRSGLWGRQADLVRILRPRLMVWENVGGALSARAASRMDAGQDAMRRRLLEAADLCACGLPDIPGLPAGEGDRTRLLRARLDADPAKCAEACCTACGRRVFEIVDGRVLAGEERCAGRYATPMLRALGRVLGDLASMGYDAAWRCVEAAQAGAPHHRLRVFVTAWPRDDADTPPIRPQSVPFAMWDEDGDVWRAGGADLFDEPPVYADAWPRAGVMADGRVRLLPVSWL